MVFISKSWNIGESIETENAFEDHERRSKLTCVLAPLFLLFWVAICFAILVPIYFSLPSSNTIRFEYNNPDKFIAERAQRILYDYDRIGEKFLGTNGNENLTVDLLLNEIQKVQSIIINKNLTMEVDLQIVSGSFYRNTYLTMYNAVQNIVVKLSHKSSISEKYLLINSHFDSKPGSPGTGDDGSMVVNMLEVMRVLVTTDQSFEHPIVFLFNGAEEVGLYGSHAFVTQHKWAKNVAAVINLDCSGSGHRELLFQHSKSDPWLLNYYWKAVKHPYASTIAEELFQSRYLPSDTDFSVFTKYGNFPGMDFAYIRNGYVYHTIYDSYDVIPSSSLQSTGDNLLELVRALSNAPELSNTTLHQGNQMVFYDFMGTILIHYTAVQAVIANYVVALATVFFTLIILREISVQTKNTYSKILGHFLIIFAAHLIGLVLAVLIPIALSFIMDATGHSMTWFTNVWLIMVLYMLPSFLGLAAPTVLWLSFKTDNDLTQQMHINLIFHAHSIYMAIILVICNLTGLRSSFIVLLPTLFFLATDIINIILSNIRLPSNTYYWFLTVIIGQILPFLLICSCLITVLVGIVPMTGRIGSELNTDLVLAGAAALFTILLFGYLVPFLNIFRHSKTTLTFLTGIAIVFYLLASLTEIGYPYRAQTSVGRVNVQAVRRVFYEYDGSINRNDSGFYFFLQDRRRDTEIKKFVNTNDIHQLAEDCQKYMACGVPIYNYQWYESRETSIWLPSAGALNLPDVPKLTVLERQPNQENLSVYYKFSFEGPQNKVIFIQPMTDVKILNWSFPADMLNLENEKFYRISFDCGKQNIPLDFDIEVKPENGLLNQPLFELGVAAHYVGDTYPRDAEFIQLIKGFPETHFVLAWPSSYERYVF